MQPGPEDSFVVDVALAKSGKFTVLERYIACKYIHVVIFCRHVFSTRTDALLFSWVLDDSRLRDGKCELRACTVEPRLIHFGWGGGGVDVVDVVVVVAIVAVVVDDDDDDDTT